MTSWEFREPVREGAPLLIGISGGSGAGKTYSGFRVARGLSGGQPFAAIDTENGRALHYADFFPEMRHAHLRAPFSPARYAEAIKAADAAGFPVIVVDSGSHEYEGEGGVLRMQEAEFERLGSREAVKMLSWAKPKSEHKAFVRQLLQTKAHVILCMRAEDKIEMVKEGNQTVVRPKASLVGADGWIPIMEKRLPFELTLSLLLTPDAPGVPKPIKLQEQHKPMVPLNRPLDEEVGKALAAWAAGGERPAAPTPTATPSAPPADEPEQTSFAAPDSAVDAAGQAHPPVGVNGINDATAAYSLSQIAERGEKGREWIEWALAQPEWPDEFRANLELFASAKLGLQGQLA